MTNWPLVFFLVGLGVMAAFFALPTIVSDWREGRKAKRK